MSPRTALVATSQDHPPSNRNMVGYQWKDGPIQVGKKPCCDRKEGANRLRKNYVGTLEFLGSTRVAQQQSGHAGCSKRQDFSPAQPRRAETRLVPSKAAGESKPEEVPTALRGAGRPYNGSWRTEKPLQHFRPPRISFGTLRISMSRERRWRTFSASCWRAISA